MSDRQKDPRSEQARQSGGPYRRRPPPPDFWTPPNRIMVRLHDDVEVEYVSGAEEQLIEQGHDGAELLGRLLQEANTTLAPMHDSAPADTLREWADEAADWESREADRNPDRLDEIRELIPGPETDSRREWAEMPPPPDSGIDWLTPFRWFVVDSPDRPAEELVADLSGIEFLHVELDRPSIDPNVTPQNDEWWSSQGYLDPAPEGVNAEFAWTVPGGDGAGIGFADVEGGWTLDHEDLAPHNAKLVSGTINDYYRGHGTETLGVVCAADNSVGCVGIAPKIGSVVVSSHDGFVAGFANAIHGAIAALACGDVLLLEIQTDWPYGLPAETWTGVHWATRVARSRGIIVVASAGNGDKDLDDVVDEQGLRIFNPDSADFRDSGAILVGAGTPGSWHTRYPGSTYGRRIDCFAWGSNVTTSTSDASGLTDDYTTSFNGTSSAAAIVAGVAVVTQGVVQAHLNGRIRPWLMRWLLSHPALGTPTSGPADRIGVMPDLAKILQVVPQLPAWTLQC